jgi:MFS family permease
MSFESLLPSLAREKFEADGAGFSYMMMAVGAGALVGVMSLTKVQTDNVRGRLLLVAGIISGVAPIALAVSPNLPLALLAAAAMGASQGIYMTLFTTIVQSIVPDGIRGRVTSISNLHIGGFMAGTNLLNGSLADIVGVQTILVVTGVAFLVIIPVSFANLHVRRVYFVGATSMATAS